MTTLFVVLLVALAVTALHATWRAVGSDGYGRATDGPRPWQPAQAQTLPFESYVRPHV